VSANQDDNGQVIIEGATLYLRFQFKTRAAVAADPTTIVFKVLDPSGNTTTYALVDFTKLATGDYEFGIDVDEDGEWNWYLSTTGSPKVAANGRFIAEGARV